MSFREAAERALVERIRASRDDAHPRSVPTRSPSAA
jgi:hypothetical protein